MDKRVIQNTLNFLLSDRIKYSGTDIGPLLEIIRVFQTEINNDGTKTDLEGGAPETES